MPTERDASGQLQWTFVPADCVNRLPFKSEGLNQWTQENDLSGFQQRLSSEEAEALDADDARSL